VYKRQVIASDQSAVPVSASALPLPTGAATETTLAALSAKLNSLGQKASAASAPVVLSTEQQAILTAIDTVLDAIKLDTASIDTRLTPVVRTHNTVSATGAGSVLAGSMSGSVFNAGNAAGTWNGISIPAGVSIPWGPIGNRDTYGIIAYDGTGTTLIIEYTT